MFYFETCIEELDKIMKWQHFPQTTSITKMFYDVSHHIYSQVWFLIINNAAQMNASVLTEGSLSLSPPPNFTWVFLLRKHKTFLSTWKLLLSVGRMEAPHRVGGLSCGNRFACQAQQSTATQCQSKNNKTIIYFL